MRTRYVTAVVLLQATGCSISAAPTNSSNDEAISQSQTRWPEISLGITGQTLRTDSQPQQRSRRNMATVPAPWLKVVTSS